MMKKILIVDDNSTNRCLLESLLEEEGYDVTAAEDGQEALDRVHADPPDLIISDILMPVMDGYALCRHCKSHEQLKKIPFIFYTATYTEAKDKKFALSLGADRFIIKPQEPDVFIRILKEVWEQKTVKEESVNPLGEEMEFFRQYNEILFSKLEKKMLDLEIAHQKLKGLEERYRLSFENVTDIIFTVDTDLNISTVSPSLEKILGYPLSDFVGQPVSVLGKVLTPESLEHALREIDLILKGETIRASIYRLITADGTMKYGEVSGSPIMHNDRIVGMISIVRDITARKQAEDELKRLNQELERRVAERTTQLEMMIKELDAFCYSVSHDLQAPLRAIDGFSRILLDKYWDQPLDETGRDYLERVCKRTQHMGQLIDDLLKLAKMSQSDFRSRSVNLSGMVRTIVEQYRQADPGRTVSVTIQEGIIVHGDPDLLQIALECLIDNAWKFTGKAEQPRVEFGMHLKEGRRTYFIRDNGVGFDMAYADKLFGAFQRLHRTGEFAGTGVGLATVKRIMTRHGGQVWAEGTVGKGATIFFTLPS